MIGNLDKIISLYTSIAFSQFILPRMALNDLSATSETYTHSRIVRSSHINFNIYFLLSMCK